ncbi:hypothetical protein COOONC_13748 [Cooperia oncophora]
MKCPLFKDMIGFLAHGEVETRRLPPVLSTAADVPSSSKSLFGTSASASRIAKTESSTTPEDRESPDIPSSSKETIVRSPEDEQIRLRRLKRFADAGSSSEDR